MVPYLNSSEVLTQGVWVSIPAWGKYFLELGLSLAQSLPTLCDPGVVSLSVPVRSCATAFITLGYFLGKICYHGDGSVEGHYESLRRIDHAVAATYVRMDSSGPKLLLGHLDPPHRVSGLRFKYGLTLWQIIYPSQAGNISLTGGPLPELKIRPKELDIREEGEFWVQTGLPAARVYAALGDNATEIALIGVRSQLTDEFRSLRLRSAASTSEGLSFADLCRLQRSNELAFKTAVISSRSEGNPAGNAHLAIFDGRSAFLVAGDRFANSHRLILADRLSVFQHDQTCREVNRLYTDYRISETLRSKLPQTPPGVSLSAFTIGLPHAL